MKIPASAGIFLYIERIITSKRKQVDKRSLSAEASGKRLKVSGKSSFLTSLDDSSADLIDVLSRPFRIAKEHFDRVSIEREFEHNYALELKKINANTELSRAQKIHFEEVEKRQLNKDKIVLHALEIILNRDSKDGGNIDPDFLSEFSEFSGRVNDVFLQEIWAHILASVYSEPNSVSIKTLQVLRCLDKNVATLFQKQVKLSYHNLIFESNIVNDSLNDVFTLHEYELISNTHDIHSTYNIPEDRKLRYGDHELEFEPITQKNHNNNIHNLHALSFDIKGFKICPAGMQIIHALKMEIDHQAVLELLHKQSRLKAKLRKINQSG